MASVCAWYVFDELYSTKEIEAPPEVYTFASPYVGDGTFVSTYNANINQFSFENYDDIVPLLPPPTQDKLVDLIEVVFG